ncbi:MAG: MmcQ/YjbR family DNA-binding protein [Chloroflexota bacterium]
MSEAIDKLRAICLALPEAVEDFEGVGSPAYKVRSKIFAMHHGMHINRSSMWCKAPSGFQQMIVGAEPERFFVPPYVGQHGWIGLWLDVEQDWGLIADLVEDSYRMTAPKRLIAQIKAAE